MSILCCFTSSSGRNKKIKQHKDDKTLQVRLQHLEKPIHTEDDIDTESNSNSKSTFTLDVPFSIAKSSTCNIKVVRHESPVKKPQILQEQEEEEEEEQVAYEAEDEHEKDPNSNRVSIDKIPIQEHDDYKNPNLFNHHNNSSDIDIINDGHLSDPGASKRPFLASPKLKRSCSNLETKRVLPKLKNVIKIVPNESYDDLQRFGGDGSISPVSIISHCSADKVILRKCSSSQILPSKSRRLWWKLFLWSHRNLHEPVKGIQNRVFSNNQEGGYSSDTLEPNRRTENSKSKFEKPKNGDEKWNSIHGSSGFWPENQWMAFSGGSPLMRVDEWVQEIPTEPIFGISNEEEEGEITFPPSPDNGKQPGLNHSSRNVNLSEEIAYANRVVHSLNSSSTVAYISGIGLKVIPAISAFSSLRSVNLSGNSIVYITPGCLPKGLHILDISRNKIGAIEGLRELTRLRILDLSYNRISRIGQGLSNCTLIKELYLAGNKISNVEGLHRLLKLIILDLSFNKITTTKALGQLVANYNSMQALNLLGNPIQTNINDDQIRKTLCGLLPKLAYLNKQAVNPQKAREVAKEAVTRAALGSGNSNGRRRAAAKRAAGGGSSSFSRHRSGGGGGGSGRHGVKSRGHHRSTKSSTVGL